MPSIDLGPVTGKSAYQSAVEAGYTGTESEFYAALETLQDAPFLPLSGGEVTGTLDAETLLARNCRIPTDLDHDIYTNLIGGTNLSVFFPGYSNRDYYSYLLFRPRDTGGSAPNNGTIEIENVSTPTEDTSAANKKYVDDKFDQAVQNDPPVIVKVRVLYADNEQEEFNVKCYPTVGRSSYSMNYSVRNKRFNPNAWSGPMIENIRIYAPQGYAFNGMYSYSGISLSSFAYNDRRLGLIWSEGADIIFDNLGNELSARGGIITGSFTLEVA